MTTFKAAIAMCGLSQREAAEFLGVAFDTVKKWCNGTNQPPFGAWVMLADLWMQIQEAGENAAEHIDPESMDRRQLANVSADDPHDPLPVGAVDAAGAVAVLTAIAERNW